MISCESLVAITAKELKSRLEPMLPKWEVCINHTNGTSLIKRKAVYPPHTFQYTTVQRVCLVDPKEPYHEYRGGIGGPPETKFVPTVVIQCELESGLITVIPPTEYLIEDDILIMHIENPNVFDWAISKFMHYFNLWKKDQPVAIQTFVTLKNKLWEIHRGGVDDPPIGYFPATEAGEAMMKDFFKKHQISEVLCSSSIDFTRDGGLAYNYPARSIIQGCLVAHA